MSDPICIVIASASEAIQIFWRKMDCFVAKLLAMTAVIRGFTELRLQTPCHLRAHEEGGQHRQ